MSKLERINSFISVIEENGFAAAARKQGVSTASISRQVARLESDLKMQLLHRTTRQLVLTEIGAEYYQHCKKALHELNEAEAEIVASQDEASGILTITSTRYFAIEHLIPHLPNFMAQNPKLRVKMELAERFPDLANENIDLIFGISADGPPELVRRKVASTRYVLCASPSYLKKYGEPSMPTDLSEHRYITHSMRKPDNVIRFKNNKEIYVEPVLWLNDTRAMCECAIQGIGIVRLHDYIVSDALKNNSLVEILANFSEGDQPVFLYYRQRRFLQAKIRKFIDFYASILNPKSLRPS